MSEGAGVEGGGDGVTVGGGCSDVGNGGTVDASSALKIGVDHKSGGSCGSCDDSQQDEDLP